MIAFLAAALFAVAGFQMLGLRSQEGNTIAELFDQAMGVFSFGMAVLALLGGLAVDRLGAIAGKPIVVGGDPVPAGLGGNPKGE